MRNPFFIFIMFIIVLLSLYSAKSEANVIKNIEHLPKYDCKTTSKPVLKKAIKKRIAQIKEERIVLIKPTCPILDDELERKKRIGYGADRDLVRDTVWNTTIRQPDIYMFGSGFIGGGGFVGSGYNLVTNVPTFSPSTSVSAVPIPNALLLFSSVVFLMLRRK